MMQWEDIIKDRLEGYESALPETCLADFRAMRTGAEASEKASPVVWWLSAAVAASLALFFLLRQPASMEEPVTIAPKPTTIETIVPNDTIADVNNLIAEVKQIPATTSIAKEPVAIEPVAKEPVVKEPVVKEPVVKEPVITEEQETVQEEIVETNEDVFEEKKVNLKAGPVAGTVLGAGALVKLISPLFGGTASDMVGDSQGPGPIPPEPEPSPGSKNSGLSFRFGISANIPVSGRFSFVSGVNYSRYSNKKDYLGIPLRLDYKIASAKWMDFYAGAGIEGYYGLDNKKAGLAIIGAGGVQANINRRIGLYIEPTVSTNMPSAFTISTGVRINIGR